MAEKWKKLDKYYMISNMGRVLSLHTDKFLNPSPDSDGYPCITIRRNGVVQTLKVHILVAGFFCDKVPGAKQVNHKDGDKSNFKESNLEWIDQPGNIKHAYDTGLMPKGENKTLAALKEKDVEKIKRAMVAGKTDSELAQQYDVHSGTISAIRKQKTWTFVLPGLKLEPDPPSELATE